MIYCYCITDAGSIPKTDTDSIPKLVGIESQELFLIPYRDIFAVVSNCSKQGYEATDENVRVHNEVLQKLMEENTVVPMAFNMVWNDVGMLKQVLQKTYPVMKASLALFKNKVELGITAISTDGILSDEKNKIAEDIVRVLGGKSVQFKKNRLFSDRLLLNAAFLVEREKIGEFSETVEELEKNNKIKIKYTGPWPPYNFIEIKVK